MWRYEQKTGRLLDKDGVLAGTGYSGFSVGKNNPDMERRAGIGPIPCGTYRILPPRESENVGHYVMDLVPCEGTDTFGRDLFRMHGDSKEHPGLASHGCIIQQRPVRELVWNSGDHLVEVVRGDETTNQEEVC